MLMKGFLAVVYVLVIAAIIQPIAFPSMCEAIQRKATLPDIHWGYGNVTEGGHTGARVPYPFAGKATAADNALVIDARAYLVVCDNTADDKTNLQFAVDNVITGGTIIVQRGNCLLKSNITFPAGKAIYFKGQGNSRIADAQAPTMIWASADFASDNVFNVLGDHSIIEGITIQGVPGNGAVGIAINANGVGLRDVSVFRMDNNGIRVGIDGTGGNSNSWNFNRVIANYNLGYGFYFHSGDNNANAGVCVNCEAAVNSLDGFRLGGAFANTFAGILAEQNVGLGVRLVAPASKNVFFGGDLDEANGTISDVQLDASTTYNRFDFVSLSPARVTDSGTLNSFRYPTWGPTKTALVTNSTQQGIANNAATTLEFDTATYADGQLFAVGTDNTKLLAPDGAKWVRLYAQGCFAADNTDGYRQIEILKGGAAFVGSCKVNRPSGIANPDIISCATPPIQVTAGDYFQLQAKQTSGAAANMLGTYTWFAIEVLQ